LSFEQSSSQHPVVLVQRPFVDDVVVVFVGSSASARVGERPGVQRDAAALRSSLPFVVAGLPLVILLESCDEREASRGDGARDGAGPTWRGRRYLTARSELVRVEKFEINGAGL